MPLLRSGISAVKSPNTGGEEGAKFPLSPLQINFGNCADLCLNPFFESKKFHEEISTVTDVYRYLSQVRKKIGLRKILRSFPSSSFRLRGLIFTVSLRVILLPSFSDFPE